MTNNTFLFFKQVDDTDEISNWTPLMRLGKSLKLDVIN